MHYDNISEALTVLLRDVAACAEDHCGQCSIYQNGTCQLRPLANDMLQRIHTLGEPAYAQ